MLLEDGSDLVGKKRKRSTERERHSSSTRAIGTKKITTSRNSPAKTKTKNSIAKYFTNK